MEEVQTRGMLDNSSDTHVPNMFWRLIWSKGGSRLVIKLKIISTLNEITIEVVEKLCIEGEIKGCS
jgi:hypothetical protein